MASEGPLVATANAGASSSSPEVPPLRRTHQRVLTCCLTSHDKISGTRRPTAQASPIDRAAGQGLCSAWLPWSLVCASNQTWMAETISGSCVV